MATQPTLKVEIAFASDPLATSPTWVDVSNKVRIEDGVHIERGRQSEFDVFESGSCTLTLSNRDRRFDPSYVSGPYYGNLIPRKQIRVSATWSAVDYVMFQGHVTGWPQSFGAEGKDATVSLEAIDGLAWLADNKVPDDLVYTYVNGTIGSLALFLRKADTAQWHDATGNGYYARPVLGVANPQSSLAPGAASTAVGFDGGSKWALDKQWTSSGAWSIGFWMQCSDPNSALNYPLGGGAGGLAPLLSVQRTLGGRLIVQGNTGTWQAQSLPGFLNNSSPHFICVTSDGAAAANVVIYVDGVARNESFSGAGAPTGYLWYLGVSDGYQTAYFNGVVQDAAAFTKQLSAAEVVGWYNYSRGYIPESSTTRITRILDDVGWPASWRTLTANQHATCGDLIYNARPALELLQEVERTEQGRVFAAKDNKLTFLDRYYVQEQTAGKTVQQIFSDDGGATALPYSTFGFDFVDIDLVNDVTVTTPTTWASASDATSITTNGRQSKKVDTILTTFTDADAMARGLVARGKNPTWRAAPIVVYPAKNTTRWANILGLELGHRVAIENTPMAVGSQNAQDVTLEHVEWDIGELWQLTIAGAPTRDVWFIVDDAASLVDGTRVIGY